VRLGNPTIFAALSRFQLHASSAWRMRARSFSLNSSALRARASSLGGLDGIKLDGAGGGGAGSFERAVRRAARGRQDRSRAPRHQPGSEKHVFELPNVCRATHTRKVCAVRLGRSPCAPAVSSRKSGEKMVDEGWNVFGSLSQCGDTQFDDLEPII